MHRRMQELRLYIRGWINYYGLSEYYRPLLGLDGWLRRRIRKRQDPLSPTSSHADVGGRVQRLVSYFPLDHKIIDFPLLKNSDWICK